MSLESVLKQLEAMAPKEVYGGHSLDDAVGAVELDIACSPVVAEAAPYYEHECPKPATAEKHGDRYYIYIGPGDFRWASADQVRRMRGRYLLLRGWYLQALPSLPNGFQQEVVGKFFPEGVFRPSILDTIHDAR